MEVVYYWYHHMMDEKNRKSIQKCIDRKNFRTFMKWYQRLNGSGGKRKFDIVYLPDTAFVYSDDSSEPDEICILERENFMKITYAESECG